MPDPPTPSEKDYLDAARAFVTSEDPGLSEYWIERLTDIRTVKPDHRAAVDSAYAAGWRAGYGDGRDDEAAGEDIPVWWSTDGDRGTGT